MKLCHVTVAETLTLELAKDKMPFDLMGVLFTVICLYIQSKNTSIYLCMFSKSSLFILLLGSLNDSARSNKEFNGSKNANSGVNLPAQIFGI